MKHLFRYIIAAVLTFNFVGNAFGYTAWPAYTDPKTGYVWEDVGHFAGNYGESIPDYVKNSGVHLATLAELEKLFTDIGPYTKDVMNIFGYTTHMDGLYVTGGYYDTSNDSLGLAAGFLSEYDGSSCWSINGYIDPSDLSPDVGLWAISEDCPTHMPEPSTFILLGAGLIGIVFVRKMFKRQACNDIVAIIDR